MITFDLPPKPAIWTPPKPAIIRAASPKDIVPLLAMPVMTMFGSLSARGFRAPGGHTVAISSTANAADESDLTTYTFTDQAIGAAASERIVVCAICAEGLAAGSRVLSSATIGGVSATILKQQTNTTGSVDAVTAIIAAAVPSGTTATVVLTFSAGMVRAACSTFRMVGGSITPYATYSDTSVSHSPQSVSMNIPALGGAVAACDFFATSGTTTWAGLTEAYDETAGYGTATASMAYGNFSTAQSSLTVSATPSGSLTRGSMSAVAFAPA